MTLGTPRSSGNAFTFAHVFRIPLRVQPLFLIMVGVFVLLGGLSSSQDGLGFGPGALNMLVILAIVAVSVLLHELGHALTARRYGVEVVDITLWPLGGIAMLRGMPDDPKIEGVVSIMGPAVNFAIAAAVLPLILLIELGDLGIASAIANPLGFVFVANLMLGAFNLLPAFPMDGGKILRSFLARNGDWLGATERAVRVGRWVAIAMIVVGIFGIPGVWRANLILALIGVFVISAGTRELWYTRTRLSGGAGGFTGTFASLMRMAAEMQQRQPQDPDADPMSGPVHDVPGSSARAPAPARPSGFSEDDVRRIEGFRGRLRRPDAE